MGLGNQKGDVREKCVGKRKLRCGPGVEEKEGRSRGRKIPDSTWEGGQAKKEKGDPNLVRKKVETAGRESEEGNCKGGKVKRSKAVRTT